MLPPIAVFYRPGLGKGGGMLKNFIILLSAQVFVAFGGLTIPPLIPFLQSALRMNYTHVGSIMTFLYFGAMVISLPAGWLTDKLSIKKMVFLSYMMMGCLVILYSLVGNYITAILLAFVMGVAYGMVNPPTTLGILVLVRKEMRGVAMSLKQTGVPLGGALAAALLPPLALRFSWKVSFIFAGATIILSGLLSQILYQPSQEKNISSDSHPQEKPQAICRRTYWDKNIIFLGIGGAFCAVVQISLVTYIILYLKDVKEFDLILAAFCLTLINIGGILGRVFWGGISDWLFKGSRKTVLKMIVSLIFLTSLILGLNITLSLLVLFVVLFIFGFSALGWNGIFLALIGELADKDVAGRAIGLCMMLTFVGNLSGPVIFGKILDMTRSYNLGWYFLCASMVGAFILFSHIKEKAITEMSL